MRGSCAGGKPVNQSADTTLIQADRHAKPRRGRPRPRPRRRLLLPEYGTGALEARERRARQAAARRRRRLSVSARSPLHSSATSRARRDHGRGALGDRCPTAPACRDRRSSAGRRSRCCRGSPPASRAATCWPARRASMAVKTTCAVMAAGRSRKRAERREIGGLQLARASPSTTGRSRWLSARWRGRAPARA